MTIFGVDRITYSFSVACRVQCCVSIHLFHDSSRLRRWCYWHTVENVSYYIFTGSLDLFKFLVLFEGQKLDEKQVDVIFFFFCSLNTFLFLFFFNPSELKTENCCRPPFLLCPCWWHMLDIHYYNMEASDSICWGVNFGAR